MLSLLRVVSKQRTLSWQQLRQASFIVRDLLREGSDETGTLLNRFARYIGIEGHRITELVPTSVRYADFFPVTDTRHFDRELKRTAANQMPALLLFAFTYRSSADPIKFVHVLNTIDDAALRLLPEMDEDTVLRTLYSLLFLMPNWITRTDFYHAALKQLTASLSHDCPREKFVQLCFYLGLNKKNSRRNNVELLQQLLATQLAQQMPALTDMDLAVVANAAYKTSTEVQSTAFNAKMVERVLNIPLEKENIAELITLLKSLRLQRVRSTDVCTHLSSWCIRAEALKQLQPRALSHLLAFFAENLWDDATGTAALVKEFMQRVRLPISSRTSYVDTLRGKDIGTFLWAASQLNCTLPEVDLQELEACLLGRVHNNEFTYFPDQLVDACLSLWQLGFKSRELLQFAIDGKADTRFNTKQPKVESRLTVLLTAAAIEEPTWQSNKRSNPLKLDGKLPAHLLKQQPAWSQLMARISQVAGVASVEPSCPINGINIVGLRVQFEGEEPELFLDIQQEAQTLHFSGAPVALLRFKAALLNATGRRTLLLKQSDLTSADDAKLSVLLLGEAAVAPDEPQQTSLHNI